MARNALFSTVRRSIDMGMRRYASEGGMPLTFASPGMAYFDAVPVKQVDVPTFSGNLGILPNHVPVLAVLKPGVITVYGEKGEEKFFVSSGSLTVNGDSSVQVLAEEAYPLDSLDAAAGKEELVKAQAELSSSGGDVQKSAEAQIKIEVLEALIRAAETGV